MFKLSWAEAYRLPWKPANPLDPLELNETVSKWLVYIKVGLTWGGHVPDKGSGQEVMSESGGLGVGRV